MNDFFRYRDEFLIHLRRHAFALAAAFVMALLVASPLVAFPYYAGEQYRGINTAQFGNDEHYYLTRGKEVLEGHGLGQPFLSEGKDAQDPTFSSAERILLAPVTLLGLADNVNVVTYYNVANAIGVFVLVLLIYALVLALSGDRWLAIGIAVFVIGGYSIVYNKALFYTDFNVYGRSLWPWASAVPLFAFLYYLYDAVVMRGPRRSLLFAGILCGLLFYMYFYAWTFAATLLATFFLANVLLHDWTGVKNTFIIGAIGLCIGAYTVARLLLFYVSPAGKQMAFFLVQQHSHAAIFSKIGSVAVIVASLFTWSAWRRREAAVFPHISFLWAIICAGWIVLNQQILTGRFVQYGHYYWYFIVPLSIIVIGYCAYRLVPVRVRFLVPVLLIVLALLNTAVGQYRSFSTTKVAKLREQSYAPLLARLNALPPGGVFTGSGGDVYEFLVTIYTRDDLYWIPAAELHLFPTERLEEVLLAYLSLNPSARRNPGSFLERELAAGTIDGYTSTYGELEAYRSGLDYPQYQQRTSNVPKDPILAPLREQLLGEISQRYWDSFAKPAAVRVLLQSRGVKYVLWDKRQYSDWDLSVLQPLELLATSTDLALYSLR